jgi:hypothetical protein
MERRPHVIHRSEEAPLMRLKVRSPRHVVRGDLAIEFVPQRLTSYGGLERARERTPAVAIVGLPLPDCNHGLAVRALQQCCPACPLLLLALQLPPDSIDGVI